MDPTLMIKLWRHKAYSINHPYQASHVGALGSANAEHLLQTNDACKQVARIDCVTWLTNNEVHRQKYGLFD